MRAKVLAVAVMLSLSSADGYAASGVPVDTQDAAPRTYIVRLDGGSLAARMADERAKSGLPRSRKLDMHGSAAKRLGLEVDQQRTSVLLDASALLGRALQPGFIYRHATHGFSVALTSEEAERLRALPGVASVREDSLARPATDAGPAWIGADQIWLGQAGVPATRGEGVVVGVIDSGVNRTHGSFAAVGPIDGYSHANPRGQLFGLCANNPSAGCNNKLIGIHDFTVCTGVHSAPDCDDREANDGGAVDGHGTHVASTAVGNVRSAVIDLPGGGASRQLSGVAPHANLITYKACEEDETCRLTWLVAAIDQAVADGVDVINYSIQGDTVSPWQREDSLAFLDARDAGIVVAVAAGNQGPDDSSVTNPSLSPWVLAVANATHDRAVVNRLVDLSGGSTAPPSAGVLLGQGLTTGIGPRRMVVPEDFPLCSVGTESDFPPSGVSNPWQPGRFNGEIVVCLRGIQARVAKSNNVRLAGGAGMVLVNQAADGEATVADEHSIPATHLGFTQGAALLQWLNSGSDHQGRLEGAQVRNEPTFADQLNSSSGRGPSLSGDYLKPDLTAPGTSILAAAGSGYGFVFLSGTSMASPHVAGSAALLLAAHPTWTADDVESALRTTSLPSITDGGAVAGAFDQGSGRARVDEAVAAGLSFRISRSAVLAANPDAGGTGRELNLPSLVHGNCFESCSFSRTVTDLRGGGRWRAELVDGAPLGVFVTPADFTLSAGASQTLSITVDTRDPTLLGKWADARIRFVPLDAQGAIDTSVAASDVAVNVFASVGAAPTQLLINNAEADRGFRDVTFDGLAALAQLQFSTTDWVAPVVQTISLGGDTTNDDPYDQPGNGTFFGLVDLPAGATARPYRLIADADSTTARDVDLFVGEDFNGNGAPDANEELCRSTTSTAVEQCVLPITSSASPRRFWVLAQNWSAGLSGVDVVRLQTRLFDMTPNPVSALRATGPGRSDRLASFPVRVIWDDPTLLGGDRRSAYLVPTAGGSDEPFAEILVEFTRATSAPAAEVLGSGEARAMRLSPASAAERLVVDVPPGASRLRARTEGNGEVDLYLAYAGAQSTESVATAPPRGEAVASATGPGANELIEYTGGGNLPAGRYYVTPANVGTSAANFTLTVEVESASALPAPRFGAFFNPARSGAGAFLFGDAASWGMLWYTYLEDGTPTWYIAAAAPPEANATQWQAELFRASWNGSAADLTAVGNAVLTKADANSFQFGWNLDGRTGSETYRYLDGGGCPQVGGAPLDVNGLWYDPTQPGYGYSVLAFEAIESNGAYFFDGNGVGRWALGSIPTESWSSPFGTDELPFDVYLGSCPSCAYTAPTVMTNQGVLTRSYVSTGTEAGLRGTMAFDIQLPAPMSGRWTVDDAVIKLTAPIGCTVSR